MASGCVGRRPNWFSQSIVLGSLSSSKEEERKGKEEGRKRKLVFFFFGLRLAWILFWFGLEFSGDKDKKCVKRHVGILGEVLSKFP